MNTLKIQVEQPWAYEGGSDKEWPAMFNFIARISLRDQMKQMYQLTCRYGTWEEWRIIQACYHELSHKEYMK